MKIQALFVLLFLIGCQKPKSEPQITNTTPENKTQTVSIVEEKFLKTDTISISDDGETSKENYILAHLLDQKADKDSVVTARYRLDFYLNKTKTADSKITIKGIEKGSEWGAKYGLASVEMPKKSPFIQISFGYPACGYTSNNYLYYLKNNHLQLVHEWNVISDSGWGTWVRFENSTSKTNTESFYCKTVSFEPENDNDEIGTVTYSDSIVFRLSGNHWKKQLLSAKDKVYFEKKIPFNEFHDLD
ncbi:hypothetical protein [Flavobacterium geliluteum]|uniref:Uncharacterized protein n=1 Tax=Flavobacterium geliluteum TaxID=2816120 RepID=A0A941AYN4_9FLAO|nr:hypothetical protein [Flavobacterium geliluteum]MBP4137982.1 hypothetical protein [Flavobacterium geliluteum]